MNEFLSLLTRLLAACLVIGVILLNLLPNGKLKTTIQETSTVFGILLVLALLFSRYRHRPDRIEIEQEDIDLSDHSNHEP